MWGRTANGLATLAVVLLAACAPPGGGPTGPTPVPEPPVVQVLKGRGITISGHGSAQTDEISPEYGGGLTEGIDLVTLTHDGRSSFIVTAIEGEQSVSLTSAIGAYTGQRPLVVQAPVTFQVTADGAWTLTVQPMPSGGQPTFSGANGDAVSAYFPPPPPGTWNLSHDGQTTFFVFAHCVGGSIVVIDSSGPVQATAQVPFPRGPCFWEVRADGAFSLAPAS